MMSAFGRFLEVSLPTRDILRSLGFYRALGFAELTTGDIRGWHYAVVTDGCIMLGLHSAGIVEPALTFVRPNLVQQVRALEAAGHEFEFQQLGAEQFHEAGLRSPDGQLILMLEARTFSPGDHDETAATLVGHCTEVSLGCTDATVTRGFFENAGFIPAAEERPEVAWLDAPGIRLGLRKTAKMPTLRFAVADLPAALRQLEASGLQPTRSAEGHVLQTPEGMRLVLGA